MEKTGCYEPPLSVGRGENHTPFGKGGSVRFGSITDLTAISLAVLQCGIDSRWRGGRILEIRDEILLETTTRNSRGKFESAVDAVSRFGQIMTPVLLENEVIVGPMDRCLNVGDEGIGPAERFQVAERSRGSA